MFRTTNLIGCSVFVKDNPHSVGHIHDLHFDDQLQRIVGMTVQQGVFGTRWHVADSAEFNWHNKHLVIGRWLVSIDLLDTTQMVSWRQLRRRRVIIDYRPYGHINDILFKGEGIVQGFSAGGLRHFGSYIFNREDIQTVGDQKRPLVVNTSPQLSF